jgi:hypothetical protein
MSRLLSAVLVVTAIVAMNSFFLREAVAEQAMLAAPKVVPVRTLEPQVTESRGGSRVLALVVALRAMQPQGVKR